MFVLLFSDPTEARLADASLCRFILTSKPFRKRLHFLLLLTALKNGVADVVFKPFEIKTFICYR